MKDLFEEDKVFSDILSLVANISDIQSLEFASVRIYSFLGKKEIDEQNAYDLMLTSLTSKFFLELFVTKDDDGSSRALIGLFLELALLGFLNLILKGKIRFSDNQNLYKKFRILFNCVEEQLNYKFSLSNITFELQECLGEDCQRRFEIKLDQFFSKEELMKFYQNLQVKSNIIGQIILLGIGYDFSLKDQLYNLTSKSEDPERTPNIVRVFNKLYGTINKVNGTINRQIERWVKKFDEDIIREVADFFYSENDRLSFEVINFVVSDMPHDFLGEDFDFTTLVIEKSKKLIRNKNFIDTIISDKIANFNQSHIGYIDKLLFITLKLLSVISAIDASNNISWKLKVIIREFFNWLYELHLILNKYDMMDDWDNIKPYVHVEDDQVEWKSSFVMSLENDNPKFKTENLQKIAETIISMMNSQGGNIIVGFIEKKEKIMQKNIELIVTKNSYYFFDLNYEFEKFRLDIDNINRTIQDNIKNDLKCSIDKFDKFFRLRKVNIKVRGKFISVYQIIVDKSDKPMYTVSDDNSYISLRKRVKGRNELVLPEIV